MIGAITELRVRLCTGELAYARLERGRGSQWLKQQVTRPGRPVWIVARLHHSNELVQVQARHIVWVKL